MELWIQFRSTIQNQFRNYTHEFTVLGEVTFPAEKEIRLAFDEPSEPDNKNNTHTYVIIQNQRVEIVRTGAIEMHQSFTLNQGSTGVYRTEDAEHETYAQTKELAYQWDEEQKTGMLTLAYVFFIHDHFAGRFHVTMRFYTNFMQKEALHDKSSTQRRVAS